MIHYTGLTLSSGMALLLQHWICYYVVSACQLTCITCFVPLDERKVHNMTLIVSKNTDFSPNYDQISDSTANDLSGGHGGHDNMHSKGMG